MKKKVIDEKFLLYLMKNIFFSGKIFLFCLFLSSCDETLVSDPQQIVFPDSNVSFQKHVQPYLNLSCNFSGCHSSETKAGNVALTSYSDLFFSLNPPLNADPNIKAENQKLVMIIEGRLAHTPAYFQTQTTENQKKGIRTWIGEGAKNN